MVSNKCRNSVVLQRLRRKTGEIKMFTHRARITFNNKFTDAVVHIVEKDFTIGNEREEKILSNWLKRQVNTVLLIGIDLKMIVIVTRL